jgi:DNA-binding transcriptional regulator LsrR (DeoR family)
VLFTYIQDGYPEQKKIAEQLNMTRQNVNTHLIRANADLIKAYIDYFEDKCGEPLQ